MNTHALLTRREAATHVRISLRSLDNKIADGSGPTVTRIGKRVLIRADHLVAWIERSAEAGS